MFRLLLLLLLICLSNSGCVSAGITGASLLYDNFDIQRNVKNQLLDIHAERKLQPLLASAESHISAIAVDSVVLLIGQTPSNDLRQNAVDAVKKVPGVKRVINQISLEPRISLSQQVQDSLTTAKVKMRFIATKEVNAARIKVVTENNVVYLMGTVPKQQAETAAFVAQHVPGVNKVVKVLRQTVVINDQPKA